MTKRIGIDLGTTNCCVAVAEGETARVISDTYEQTIMPSIIAQLAGGEVVVGDDAKAAQTPLHRYAFVKRWMGANVHFRLEDGMHSAASISSFYLRELKGRAEAAVGGEVAAIVTVPAHFGEAALDATREAAREAGLPLIGEGLIREPVAAAVAYYAREKAEGLQAHPEESILVYDLGGGTMDATVCIRRGSRIDVAGKGTAFAGNSTLGGFDFDRILANLALEQAQPQLERLGISTVKAPEQQGLELAYEPWYWQLLLHAETIKKRLSTQPRVEWSQELTIGASSRPVRLSFYLDRKAFESKIEGEIDETLTFCDEALIKSAFGDPAYAGLPHEDVARRAAAAIGKVILVGGSTRIPLVRERIARHLQQTYRVSPPIEEFDPDLCVAYGAALYARVAPESRSTAPVATASGASLTWEIGPAAAVGDTLTQHTPLRGIVAGATPGSTVHVTVGTWTASVALDPSTGRFTVPAFPLNTGENELALEVRDPDGASRLTWGRVIHRGGFAVGASGLARPIQLRLLQGLAVLLREGARPGEGQTGVFFVADTTGHLRLPLYDGSHPLGEEIVEFPQPLQPGAAVKFRSLYEPGLLSIEVTAGENPPQVVKKSYRGVDIASETATLWERAAQLEQLTGALLSELPREFPAVAALARERETQIAAIRRESDSRVGPDIARVDDRVRRLDMLQTRMRMFQLSAEGLQLRIMRARESVQSGAFAADAPMLAELDAVEAALAGADEQSLRGLATKVGEFERKMRSSERRPAPLVTRQEVKNLLDAMRAHIAECRQMCPDVANDGATHEQRAMLDLIEKQAEEIFETEQDVLTCGNRLYSLYIEQLKPVHYAIVVRTGREGLLSERR